MPIREQPARTPIDEQNRPALRFPRGENAAKAQNEEWFEYLNAGRWRRLRIHDYDRIFSVPGLYEALVYDALQCRSPERITGMLAEVIEDWSVEPADLRVLDLGAGNGIVAEHLRERGVEFIMGVDLLEEAALAAERDRPDAYDEYLVADLCDMNARQEARLARAKLNCLVTVAALGFGDTPPGAFAGAFNAVDTPGWLAMAIKEDFLSGDDESGFSRLVRSMIAEGIIEIESQRRYCHRLSMAGEKLFYVGIIARKLADIPQLLHRERCSPARPDSPDPRPGALITDTFDEGPTT